MKTKFLFAVASKYPTPKAYGVTIGRTVAAVMDNYPDSIILTGENRGQSVDEYGNPIVNVCNNRLTRHLSHKSVDGPLHYVIWQFVFGLLIKRNLDEPETPIYLREVYTTLVSSLQNRNNVHLLEIHHHLKGIRFLALRFVSKRNNVQVVFISEDLKKRQQLVNFRREPIVIPMAVPENFFCKRIKYPVSTESIKIVFAGKSHSNGVDNGLNSFLVDLFKAKLKERVIVTFVGLENEDIHKVFVSSIRSNSRVKIRFVKQVLHDFIPKILINQDWGLIPYPNNGYHRDRFPIKSLEYAATKTVILASDTPGNRSTIPSECGYFYEIGNPTSLEQILNNVDRKEILGVRERAYLWAKEHTYGQRAALYIELLKRIALERCEWSKIER